MMLNNNTQSLQMKLLFLRFCFVNSRSHVRWVMEVIGDAMRLPLDEDGNILLIKQSISIYSQWLQGFRHPNDSIPPPVIADPEPYYEV